jgi:outer membrane immunogenic protein
MKRVILITAATLAIIAGTPALAADLPQAAPPPQAPAVYVPTVAPVYNWGGIYFGVNGGYGFGSTNWTISPAGSPPSTGNFNATGFVVGPTLGVNFQTDAFVFGIEGDFDGSWMDGKDSSCKFFVSAMPTTSVPATCETKNTWLGTLRARAGYAADRVLFYATAGGAFGDIRGNTSGTSFQSKSEPGWTAGAGVEVAFADNWTARVEYLFVDLENASLAATPTGSTMAVKFDANLIRLGVDYKFR